MFSISGYETKQQLHASEQSLVFRATRNIDGRAVILKVLKDIRPSPARIKRFEREYRIVKELELPGVVAAYDLVHASNHWVFVQEDFGGESLAQHGLAGKVGLLELLSIATGVARHLAAIHRHAVIHKDVNPSNIVLDRSSGTIKLIDFGIATRLSRETAAFGHPDLVEGTPAYLSPEQTGRTSHPLDHRTDLYSLGCTLYALLTGRPPFESSDLIELIHCHLARRPEPVSTLRRDVPSALEAIIDKLLAKNASDRYQSAEGVEADLVRCLEEWQAAGSIASFEPGARDVAWRLMPPSRLYGRREEIEQLTATFDRVAGGTTELLVISGGAGIGKSSLVKELYTPVTRRRGFFVAGKLDQFQRSTPYRPVLDMLDELIGQVLMEPPARVAQWVVSLQHAAGIMLPALADVLPRLELLYERLPPLPELPPEELGFRFRRALAACLRAFARREHPLVLFIDDLQWADSASLELVKVLMSDGDAPYLMVVGAHRDNDTPATQSLRNTVIALRELGVPVGELLLQRLETVDTTALVAQTLGRAPASVEVAGAIIHEKTGGNPFFTQAFLEALLVKGVLSLDRRASCWQFDLDQLRLLESSDNVVELLIDDMQRLPRPTRELITCAACIGNRFEPGLLAAVAGRTEQEVADSLMPALQGNHLIPITSGARPSEVDVVAYKFAHDRVQQAAYGLEDAEARAKTHLRIGRAMKQRLDDTTNESLLLATAEQLNRALHLIDDADERRQIAALDHTAGTRALRSVVHAAALDYFQHGLACLGGGDRAFEADHRLARVLAEGAAEAAYLDADFEQTNSLLDLLSRHSNEASERAQATLVRINALIAQQALLSAIEVARELLGSFGVVLPAEPTTSDIEALFCAVDEELGGRQPQSLADLPAMTNVESLAALRVLSTIFAAAFLAQPMTSVLIAAHAVRLTLRHGLAEESARAFILYGMALCGSGQPARGYEYGCLAESLIEKRKLDAQIPFMAVAGFCYVLHWQRPLRGSIPRMRDAYAIGLETGQVEQGVNSLQCATAVGFLAGCNLRQIDEEYVEITPTLMRHKQGPYLTWLRQYHQMVRNFRGLSANPTLLQGDVYDELAELTAHRAAGDLTAIYMRGFNKMLLCYHHHEYAESLRYAHEIKEGNQPGSIWLVVAEMYRGLAALATCDGATPEYRATVIDEVGPLVDRMRQWGETSRTNYAHKYHLMAAELCRVSGRTAEAKEHYDLAADLARAHEYTHEEGLAFERAALFYLEQGSSRLASYYMNDAYYAFERWGADAKLELLRKKYGDLLDHGRSHRARSPIRATKATERGTTTRGELGELDLATVLAASRAIAGETSVDDLLHTVMRVFLENAGAERGFLLLARGDRLLVKVRAEVGDANRFQVVSLDLDDQGDLAHSVVRYVARTAEPVVLDDAVTSGPFVQDPHIRATACKSVLCLPILSRGKLVAISYLENGGARAVFDEDRLDVLTLLMGQAAISVENALLRAGEDVGAFHFRVGGSLPPDSPTYVRREADELLAGNIRRGELCYIFNTRQMGKSSLRVRTVDRLREDGVRCVSVDISAIGSHGTTAQQWYAGIARALVTGLGLHRDLDLRAWWRDRDELSPVQRLDVLLDEEILERVDAPIAIFIDEVDSTLALDFSADDFFALIRLLYNRRAEDPRYRRLSVILLGVATPSDLIRDQRVTPFNIGRAIPLSGFRFDEAANLATGLAHLGDGRRLLRAVLEWTCGQPFLTQKLCRVAAEEESRPVAGKEREWVASLVRTRIIDKWRHHDEPRHLGTIESRILEDSPNAATLVRRYLEILERGEVGGDDSSIDTTLVLSGIVTRAYDRLRVGNPVYAAVFDRAWVEACLPRHQ
jgi:predicted ATPase/GAF domain-containing protein